MTVRLVHATATTPGAIAIIQLIGEGCEQTLRSISGVDDWPLGRAQLVNLAGVDDGLACMLTPIVAQIMPHGGPRVIQRITAKLLDLGAVLGHDNDVDPLQLFPEASDRFEALMLLALSRAASPLAVDLLLDQPRRWRAWAERRKPMTEQDRARSARLQRLIDPPIVVLAGAPNVGKSTVSNALLGRSMSITANVAGTTRDYTAALIDLGGLTVQWHDTPGVRVSDDPTERTAIDIAKRLIERADLLVAMRDAQSDWPLLTRSADIFVLNKVDSVSPPPSADSDLSNHEGQPRERDGVRVRDEINGAIRPDAPLPISALHRHGLAALVRVLRNRLVSPEDLTSDTPWLFDHRLLVD